ncbi:MAG: translation elongation factor Ts [bacterium]|nr:translation elongation factor Ts [bacterium]
MAITAAMVKELREMTGAAMMDCKKALDETAGDMDAAKEFLRKKGAATADKKSSRETKEGAISIVNEGSQAGLVKIACETDFVAINDDFQKFIAGLAAKAMTLGAEAFEAETKEDFTTAIAKMGENMSCLELQSWKAAAGNLIGAYVHGTGSIGVLVEVTAGAGAEEKAKDLAMHIAANKVEAISEADLDPSIVEKERVFQIEQAKESGKPQEIAEKMVMGRMNKFKKEICLVDQPFVKDPDKTIKQWLGGIEVVRFYKAAF